MNRLELSQKIIDTCMEMTRLGLNQGTAGNVSVRYKDGMLITPTGKPYELTKPEDIVYVDKNGKHEEGKLPSSEWQFHLAVYQARPEANAVVPREKLCRAFYSRKTDSAHSLYDCSWWYRSYPLRALCYFRYTSIG